MTRGNNKNIVFRVAKDYERYLELLARFKRELAFDLYHYCLMPNHVHLLVRTTQAQDFSLFMKKINLSYFRYYKQKYQWVGHFWQDRYKSQPVGKDDYFIQCGKYIELNPVRAGLVEDPGDYQFSSYRYYCQGQLNPLLTNDIFYDQLGVSAAEKREAYRRLVVGDLVTASYQKSSWGSEQQRYNENKKTGYHIITN